MMKGLFIKDFGLMKGQKPFFAAVLLMTAMFMVVYESFSFVIPYITIMIGMLTLTTISYDDFENGLGYLFTLPVSRREYVGEKYLFSIVTTLPGLILVSAGSLVVSRIRGVDFTMEECVLSVISSFLMVTVMLAIFIPLQLKFGVDKSRVAMMMVFGGGALALYAGAKICDVLGINWMAAIDVAAKMEPAVVLTGIAVICAVVLVISYLFSLRFIEKREF